MHSRRLAANADLTELILPLTFVSAGTWLGVGFLLLRVQADFWNQERSISADFVPWLEEVHALLAGKAILVGVHKMLLIDVSRTKKVASAAACYLWMRVAEPHCHLEM